MWKAAGKMILLFWMLFSSSEGRHRLDTCPSGWSCSYETSYYKYISSPKSWVEAEIYCQGLLPGAHLASVHSFKENDFIRELVLESDKSGPHIWIGASDCYKDRTFMWVDGTGWNFQFWNEGEPNNYNGQREPCVHTTPGGTNTWNDEPCSKAHPFVCKVHEPLNYIG